MRYTFPVSPENFDEESLGVLPFEQYSGPWGTVPELLFEKKGLIPKDTRVTRFIVR
jgi:hypothetical protein